jgi:hypothetical protein
MGKSIVEWDDFTGGYYVGPSATKQPRNTFQGDNVTVAMDDATLIPMYPPTVKTLTGTDTSSGKITAAWVTGLSGPAISQPVQVNGIMCFVAKTSTNVYLYTISGSTVARHDVTLAGTVDDFIISRPVMLTINVTAKFTEVYIAGDQDRLIVCQLNATGAVTSTTYVNIKPVMDATSADRLTGITIWGARMIGWSSNSYLYFSEASVFTTAWAATNYIVIGHNNDTISNVIARNFDLLVGKPTGWYVVTGVLNYSAAVRQVNNGMGIVPDDPVSEWNNQVVFNTDTGTVGWPVNLYTLNGARVSPMAFQRFAGNVQNVSISKGPLGILQVGLVDNDDTIKTCVLWWLNQQERWSKALFSRATTASSGETLLFQPAHSIQSRSDNWTLPDVQIMEIQYPATGNPVIAVHNMKIPSFEPGASTAGVPTTATVRLVDFMSKTPISVTDIFVEVELTQLNSDYDYTADGNVACTINMKYPLGDLPISAGNVSSSTLTYTTTNTTIPGTGTRFLGRMFRFQPNNGGHGYGFEVQVAFAGCKLRRVLAITEDHV